MGHLFYLVGIFVLLTIISNLFNLNSYYRIRYWINTFKKVTQSEPKSSDFREKKDHDIFLVYNLFTLCQFFWYLVGITSASWYIFISLIVVNFLINLIVFNLPQGAFGKIILHLFLTSKLIVVFALILNHFHFHYDWLLLIPNR